MPTQAWFDKRVAPTKEALAAGDGCHADDAKALADSLDGLITIDEAAIRITSSILAEIEPREECYRLWGLLCDALVELNDHERRKTMDLLLAIRNLPSPSPQLIWSQLPGFASMWDTLHRLHLQGPAQWEADIETMTETTRTKIRRQYSAVGTAEAEMFLSGLIPAAWGFKVLNLLHSERRGLDIFLSEIHAWLEVASGKLRDEVKTEHGSARWQVDETATAEHWAAWKEQLLQLSREGSGLSEEGRRLAVDCYDCM